MMQDRKTTSRCYQRVADLQVSTTDPDATLMQTKNGADLGYHTHFVVDGGKARIILHVLVTPSEVMDNQPMRDLPWRVNSEALMIAAGLNLKRLLKKRGWGRRPFPAEAMCAFFLVAFGWFTHPLLKSWSFPLPIGSDYSPIKKQCIPLY